MAGVRPDVDFGASQQPIWTTTSKSPFTSTHTCTPTPASIPAPMPPSKSTITSIPSLTTTPTILPFVQAWATRMDRKPAFKSQSYISSLEDPHQTTPNGGAYNTGVVSTIVDLAFELELRVVSAHQHLLHLPITLNKALSFPLS